MRLIRQLFLSFNLFVSEHESPFDRLFIDSYNVPLTQLDQNKENVDNDKAHTYSSEDRNQLAGMIFDYFEITRGPFNGDHTGQQSPSIPIEELINVGYNFSKNKNPSFLQSYTSPL